MKENQSFQGAWYLPNAENEAYSGTFTYDRENGCYLEIIGSFGNMFIHELGGYEIILGKVIGGKDITLVNCSRRSGKSSSNGVSISKYYAQFALIGKQYHTSTDITFDTIFASIEDIWKWVGIYGAKDLRIGFGNQLSVDIQYQKPEKINFELSQEFQCFFDFATKYTILKQVDKYEIEQKTYIGLKATNLIPFTALLHHFNTIYKFLCLCYYDSPPLLQVFFDTPSTEEGQRIQQVELLFADNYLNSRYKAGKEDHEFLFTYRHIQEQFPMIVKTWFTVFEKLSASVNLFMVLLLKKDVPLELKFLTAIQAIETFHRNVYGGTELPEEEHKERIQEIIGSVPDKHKKWLASRLEYSNEPRLRKRIKDLYNRIPADVTSKLIKDRKSFINKVISARNYFTHYDSTSKANIMNHSLLLEATEKLKILLTCLILNEIGMSEENIIEFVPVYKVYPFREHNL